MRTTLMAVILLAAPLLAALPAQAQLPQRIRGTVASLGGETLVVHGRDGNDITVKLAPDAAVRVDAPTTVAAIKPGSTLGIVSRGPADQQVAVAIRIVPTGSMSRLGTFPWDMMPQSTMTNAVVEGQSLEASAQMLTLKAGDTVVHMAIAPDAVVAESEAGERSLLVPGAKVVVFATPDGSGLASRAVVVGKGDFTPAL